MTQCHWFLAVVAWIMIGPGKSRHWWKTCETNVKNTHYSHIFSHDFYIHTPSSASLLREMLTFFACCLSFSLHSKDRFISLTFIFYRLSLSKQLGLLARFMLQVLFQGRQLEFSKKRLWSTRFQACRNKLTRWKPRSWRKYNRKIGNIYWLVQESKRRVWLGVGWPVGVNVY